jgi:Recombinase
MYGVRMARRRLRRRREKAHRHAPSASGVRVLVREATEVERLAYTRRQAAEALGISTSTFNRRVLPFIETLQMDWGTRLIPVDELERVLAERRQQAQEEPAPPARPGRRAGLPRDVVIRIRDEHVRGKSLGEIARGLDADGVRTSQGGRRWWPSTVRAVLAGSGPPDST